MNTNIKRVNSMISNIVDGGGDPLRQQVGMFRCSSKQGGHGSLLQGEVEITDDVTHSLLLQLGDITNIDRVASSSDEQRFLLRDNRSKCQNQPIQRW